MLFVINSYHVYVRLKVPIFLQMYVLVKKSLTGKNVGNWEYDTFYFAGQNNIEKN